MGQGFSLTTLVAGSAAAGIDVPELADLTYEKSMGTARFMKSIRARHADAGVVLVKVVVKPYAMDLKPYRQRIIRERRLLADVPNAMAYQRLVETETSGFLVRQYLYSSLYDRLSTRPFLEDVEKKWLAFQLLGAVRDCHARGVHHGDIKTENVLVTSWNWLYLADFSAAFKPPMLPEDNPADFSYFFDTAGRRTCYLAPERFVAAGGALDPRAHITWAMDIFSAGCVIAELFLEAPIFNLSQVYKYRKGDFDPVAAHLHRIADPDVRDLVTHMLQIDPEARYSADEYLSFWRAKAFPEYFYGFLHQYLGNITDPTMGRAPISGAHANLGEADDRINRLWLDFDKIAYFLDYADPEASAAQTRPVTLGLDLLPVHLNIPNNNHAVSRMSKRPSDGGSLIFLTVVTSAFRHTARATAKIRACDLLLAFAERLSDEAKLDRVLPFLVSLLSDQVEMVQVAAIRSITQLMALVLVVSPINAHVFPEYILPRMQAFLPTSSSHPSTLVRTVYAACLGSLASSAARFLDMITTLRADGSLPTTDHDAQNGGDDVVGFEGLFDHARAELVEVFETHTKALITDRDSAVKRAFLGSVPELCIFFGTADSNDIILSHLNTYLNDRHWMLKCAFFETVVGVATFLGGTSLEEFILPLMVQALADSEDFVLYKAIQSFAHMAELGLFSRAKTWELIDIVSKFTMHPTIWIREAAANFLSSSTKYLSLADVRCIVLPLISSYLRLPTTDLSELALLDALKRPLPRPVLDLSLTWATKVSKGIFWRPVNKMRTLASAGGPAFPSLAGPGGTLASLQKVPKNEEDEQWITKLRNLGMTSEDEFKLLALREYIWRLAPVRAREAAVSPVDKSQIINLRDLGITPQTVIFNDRAPEEDRPQRRSEPIPDGTQTPHTIEDALLDASMSIDDTLIKRRKSAALTVNARAHGQSRPAAIWAHGRNTSSLAASPTGTFAIGPPDSLESRRHSGSGTNSPRSSSAGQLDPADLDKTMPALKLRHRPSAIDLLHRKDSVKSVPETQTTSTNAFGKVEGPHLHRASSPASIQERDGLPPAKTERQPVHDYAGSDPSILKMLSGMVMSGSGDPSAIFGPRIALSLGPGIPRANIAQVASLAYERSWRPERSLVATFAEHHGPIRYVLPAPDHVFFLTAGDDGTVKVWDTGRLERNIAHRSRQTHKQESGAPITALCMVERTHSFVSCCNQGSIEVVRVDATAHSGSSVRYGKLKPLRRYQLPNKDEYVTSAVHFSLDNVSTLLVATNHSRIVAIDIQDPQLQPLYVLEIPLHHGAPSALFVDNKRNWAIVGTAYGVLNLLDLRFSIRLHAWSVPGSHAIKRILPHPVKGRGRWICVAAGSEVMVWDVERVTCREVYRIGANGGSDASGKTAAQIAIEESHRYEARMLDDEDASGAVTHDTMLAAVDLDSRLGASGPLIEGMCIGMDVVGEEGKETRHGFIITAGTDNKVRFWDTGRVENSCLVSGGDAPAVYEAGRTGRQNEAFTVVSMGVGLTVYAEEGPGTTDASGSSSDVQRDGAHPRSAPDGRQAKRDRPARSTLISLQQQRLLRNHLDAVLDVALLRSPYGMVVSVDRMGVVMVYQ